MFGLIRGNHWTELAGLHRDLDALFGRNFGRPEMSGQAAAVDGFTPATEVTKDDNKWIVSVYLPGVPPKNVDIEVVGQTLRIRGERTREQRFEPYLSEVTYGKFEREFTLPSDIDGEHVEARCMHGVLELTLPIKESAKPRKIEILSAPEMKQIKVA